MNKRETHIVTGMTRDMSAGRFDNKFVVDARNIRITATKGNSTLLSVTNEKGTGRFSVDGTIEGVILGHAVLNKTLVLFTTEHTYEGADGLDRIYRLDFSEDFSGAECQLLFEGDLNFYYKNPLETLPYYETDSIQKVYWVDGRNQPRMIDIQRGRQYNPDVFNFNRKIGNNHIMVVEKYNTGGEFPAGTVQYCFNYFNKFGQETNLVDVSPLYYLCPQENGLPADAMDTSSFVITIDGIDPHYEYVRLYSIVRTSENATPVVRIVGDYNISTLVQIENQVANPTSVQVNLANLYLLDTETNERTLLTDLYPDQGGNIDIPLKPSEYLYDSTTGKVYCVWRVNHGGQLEPYKQDFIKVSRYNIWIIESSLPYPYQLVSGDILTTNAKAITVVDNGIVGSTIDASTLLFVGGQDIIAGTFTSKNNTLFLGNIRQNIPNVGTLHTTLTSTIAKDARGIAVPCVFNALGIKEDTDPSNGTQEVGTSDSAYYNYPYNNNKSSYDKKSFKAREGYRLGFIAQYNTGQWSEAIWIDDLDETYTPSNTLFFSGRNGPGWYNYYKKPGFEATLPITIVNALIANGFIRVAPIACYPEDADKKVPFQGLLASTVYNVLDRNTNSPFVQADWRFRVGYDDNRINGEIQCNTFDAAPNYPVYATSGGTVKSVSDFLNTYGNQYYRDSSILTFHSPDVEFNDGVTQGDLLDLKMRIVGLSTLSFVADEHNIFSNQIPERTLAAYLYLSSKGFGAKSTKRDLNYFADWRNKQQAPGRRRIAHSEETTIQDYYSDLAYIGFYDNALEEDETGKIKANYHSTYYDWVTYLWHRNGSLNNQAALSEAATKYGSIRYAMLERKCISETQYSRTTFFQTPQTIGPSVINIDINQPVLFDSDQLGITKINVRDSVGIDYYGNIDKVITPTFANITGSEYQCPVGTITTIGNLSDKGYPLEYSSHQTVISTTTGRKGGGSSMSYVSRGSTIGGDTPDYMYGTDPVHMRYKSTKHIVFGLATSENVIPQLAVPPTNNPYPTFWKDNENIQRVDVLNGAFSDFTNFTDMRKSVFIAELYREFTPEREAARFGGTSENAISNNVWKRCGDSVKLVEDSTATIFFKEGDTYVGRYDCLKTYPFSPQDQNQIVSIFSTELESRVNLDARYDKNKGLTDNTFANPTNFDLFNHPGYEQSNQFFTFKAIDYDRYKSLNYPNLITFSTEKKPGADIDAWTSIPMLSTFDMKGDLGEITKLTTFNDNIFSFQNRGVAQILFNERVQIPTSDGQPIEITNGLKYSGYRYLSDKIGLTNKWSLTSTPYGIYFIDDEKNTLYQFGGQQFQDLSGKFGFRTWLSDHNSYEVWNPVDFGNIVTWYDKVNGDLYFMDEKESLVFSEQVGNFISFMDYGALPIMVNMNDRFLTSTINTENGVDTVWELWAGEYNMFFGMFKPYWLTFISNTDPTVDKIFNTLAWRTFDYSEYSDEDKKGILQPMSTFDTVRVWHDHQDTDNVNLTNTPGKPSPLKKKFNVFRALISRDRLGLYAKAGRDRIRNTWTYIQLSRYQTNTDLMVFNDLEVDFFE